MVTYSDMFQFCMLIVAVISLVVKVCNSKKSNRPFFTTAVTSL